jgi:hypothetical protein
VSRREDSNEFRCGKWNDFDARINGSNGTPSTFAISYSSGSRTSMTLMPRLGLSSAFFMSCTVTAAGWACDAVASAGAGAMPQIFWQAAKGV